MDAKKPPPESCRRCGAAPPVARFRTNAKGYWHQDCADCLAEKQQARRRGGPGSVRSPRPPRQPRTLPAPPRTLPVLPAPAPEPGGVRSLRDRLRAKRAAERAGA